MSQNFRKQQLLKSSIMFLSCYRYVRFVEGAPEDQALPTKEMKAFDRFLVLLKMIAEDYQSGLNPQMTKRTKNKLVDWLECIILWIEDNKEYPYRHEAVELVNNQVRKYF